MMDVERGTWKLNEEILNLKFSWTCCWTLSMMDVECDGRWMPMQSLTEEPFIVLIVINFLQKGAYSPLVFSSFLTIKDQIFVL